jgi:uncharacterized protein (DUF1015 family)
MPPPNLVSAIAAVPYDVVDTPEALTLAEGNPASFLRVTRPELELPAGTDPCADAVYERAKDNFRRFRESGRLQPDVEPNLYVYCLQAGTNRQRGIMGCFSVHDYETNTIRKHERTRPDKENDRLRHILALGAHAEPVLLAFRDDPEIASLVSEAEKSDPLFDFTAVDGVRHTVWRAVRPDDLVRAFARVPACYIADGHHRAAAAARAARTGRAGEAEWFMALAFPAGELRILPYNRLVRDLNGRTPQRFLAEVRARFTLRDRAPPAPVRPRTASLYLQGRWYGLEWAAEPGRDAVSSLDVSVLQERLLGPVLGVRDPRTDKRIEFFGGARGPAELESAVNRGRAAVAFSLHSVTLQQVMAVADAGEIMPPKSTWFDPKPRSGLLVHVL